MLIKASTLKRCLCSGQEQKLINRMRTDDPQFIQASLLESFKTILFFFNAIGILTTLKRYRNTTAILLILCLQFKIGFNLVDSVVGCSDLVVGNKYVDENISAT